ncbi:MAG: sigma-70 family RNA polymerase sigma factor [Myxococcota bacterium]
MTDESAAKAELIEACYRAGASAFPLVAWSVDEFAAACGERWAAQPARAIAERLGAGNGRAEEYLVAACLAGRRGAVETLEREYIVKLVARVRQVCKSSDVADDALQALREKLLLPPEPRLAAYENRGHLAAWLTIVAMRTALDILRRTQPGALRATELDEELITHAISPESQYSTRQFDVALRQAMRAAVRRLPDKQRFALKMQIIAGWSIDQIGVSLSMHRATAARWLIAAREQLENDVREALVQELGISALEVDGAIGAMRSRLDLRISQFFQSSAGASLVLQSGGE